MTHRGDDLFEEVCDALAVEIEDVFEHDAPVPDLYDVFARARALDESAIVAGLSPDVDPALLHVEVGELDSLHGADPGMVTFRDALRGELVARGDAEGSSPPQARHRTGAWTRVAMVGVVAAAAVAALWLVPWQPLLGEEEAPRQLQAVEAQMQADDRRVDDSVIPRTRRQNPAPEPEPEPELEPEPEPEPELERAPRLSTDVLEQRARGYWEAGDLDRAAATFRKVIARSGKSSAAELAFGDLFAIAREQGGRRGLAKVWREYLQRFPKGRYADDARGGLCRSADADTMQACWDRYLIDFPAGAHAEHARAAIAKDTSP